MIDDPDGFLVESRTQAFIVIEPDNTVREKYCNGAEHDSMVTSVSVAKASPQP